MNNRQSNTSSHNVLLFLFTYNDFINCSAVDGLSLLLFLHRISPAFDKVLSQKWRCVNYTFILCGSSVETDVRLCDSFPTLSIKHRIVRYATPLNTCDTPPMLRLSHVTWVFPITLRSRNMRTMPTVLKSIPLTDQFPILLQYYIRNTKYLSLWFLHITLNSLPDEVPHHWRWLVKCVWVWRGSSYCLWLHCLPAPGFQLKAPCMKSLVSTEQHRYIDGYRCIVPVRYSSTAAM